MNKFFDIFAKIIQNCFHFLSFLLFIFHNAMKQIFYSQIFHSHIQNHLIALEQVQLNTFIILIIIGILWVSQKKCFLILHIHAWKHFEFLFLWFSFFIQVWWNSWQDHLLIISVWYLWDQLFSGELKASLVIKVFESNP